MGKIDLNKDGEAKKKEAFKGKTYAGDFTNFKAKKGKTYTSTKRGK